MKSSERIKAGMSRQSSHNCICTPAAFPPGMIPECAGSALHLISPFLSMCPHVLHDPNLLPFELRCSFA